MKPFYFEPAILAKQVCKARTAWEEGRMNVGAERPNGGQPFEHRHEMYELKERLGQVKWLTWQQIASIR